MEKIDKHLVKFAKAAVSLFPKISREEQQIDVALYRLLARGKPVAKEDIAKALEFSSKRVSDYLGRMRWVEYNDTDQIVAFRGLSLEPTSHRLEVEGKTLYTWCALDTLFIPQILEKTVHVESSCPVTGDKIRFTVGSTGISQLNPKDAAISLVIPQPSKAQENVIGHFCCYVHFFSSTQAGSEWSSEHRGSLIISVHEAYDIGRRMNKVQYKETLLF